MTPIGPEAVKALSNIGRRFPSTDCSGVIAFIPDDGAGFRPLTGYMTNAEAQRTLHAPSARVELRDRNGASVGTCAVVEFVGPDFGQYRLWDLEMSKLLDELLHPTDETPLRRVAPELQMVTAAEPKLGLEREHRLRLNAGF